MDSRETVEGAALELERTWLALRTRAGLARVGWTAAQESLVESWVDRGWAEYTAGGVRLTPAGWLLLDRLAVEFDEARSAVPA